VADRALAGHDQVVTTEVRSAADLRELYKPPSQRSLDKTIDHLDEHCRSFLAHCTLAMLATADAAGNCDVSPKGGPAGFARVLDSRTLAIGDLAGNNRLDSFTNVITSAGVGLLFLIPGRDETLRVNGTASITTDTDVLGACALDGLPPFKTALVVEVTEAFLHCAKAMRRSSAWHPEEWPDTSAVPSMGCMIRDHAGLDTPADELDATLEVAYADTIWQTGGKA
jgi:hypothetical protein